MYRPIFTYLDTVLEFSVPLARPSIKQPELNQATSRTATNGFIGEMVGKQAYIWPVNFNALPMSEYNALVSFIFNVVKQSTHAFIYYAPDLQEHTVKLYSSTWSFRDISSTHVEGGLELIEVVS